MISLLPAWPLFSAFVLASTILAITPGPGVLYIITRSVAQGRKAGLGSVAGVALGNLGNAFGSSLGLAALFALSSVAFTAVKTAGAAYLIYLGITAIRATSAAPPPAHLSARKKVFRDGFLVALLNPKTTIFFAAFLPQFLDAPEALVAQTMLLGAIFVLIAACTDSIYALAASKLSTTLAHRTGALGRWISGTIFIALGIFTALSGGQRAHTPLPR